MSKLTINQKLNLVITVTVGDEGEVIYVHSTPIEKETFDRYYLILAKTYGVMLQEFDRSIFFSGPRVAAKMIKDLAIQSGRWDGPTGVNAGLIDEIIRLSNVLVPGTKETIPLDHAIKNGIISEDDADEVLNMICFFTCISLMRKATERTSNGEMLSAVWGVRATSSSISEFLGGLPISTATANGATKAAPSSTLSSIGQVTRDLPI